MAHRVYFRRRAESRLLELYDYISAHAGEKIAWDYICRIREACLGLADFPERGTRRDDILPGLRVIGFERRVTIAFRVLRRR